ncbi:MAG: Gfo/Idh/MocA family oxidoreductase, partial [Myxococcota bacterium]
ALQAFEMGLHVLIEKPIASTVAEAQQLIDAARSAERILQVGHTERFNPAVAASLRVLEAPGYVVAERLGPFTGRSTDIDVVLDLMIHDLDIVAAMVDSPLKEVRSVGVPMFTGETDMAAARLEFENGAVAQLSASRGSLEPSRKIRVFTRERYVSIDCQSREVKSIRRTAGSEGALMQLSGEPIDVPDGDALAAQDDDFLRAIEEKRAPVVTGEQGLRALALAEAVKQALTIPIPG